MGDSAQQHRLVCGFFCGGRPKGSALLHSVSLWYLGDETECRVGTPYMERNFIDSLPKAKVDQSGSVLFAKNTFMICAGATKILLGPFHNFLAQKLAFFDGHYHFMKKAGRIWEWRAEELSCWYYFFTIICTAFGHFLKMAGRILKSWAESQNGRQKSCSLDVCEYW